MVSQNNKVIHAASQSVCKDVQMFFPLSQEQRRSLFFESLLHVGKNKIVSSLIFNDVRENVLNSGIRILHGKFSCSANQLVLKLRSCLLTFRMDRIADRSALHVNDRLVPVPSIRRCCQTDNVLRFHLVQDPLK
jgi:hypothetical protein